MPLKPTYEELEQRVLELERQVRQRVDRVCENEDQDLTLSDTTSAGIWVLDAEARTTYVDRKMAGMLQYSMDEIMGRALPEFLDDESGAILGSKLRNRRKGRLDQYGLRFLRKDGSSFQGFVNLCPLIAPGGQVVGSFATVSDRAEDKKTEELLKSERHRLRSALEMLPAIVWLQAQDYSIRYANSKFRQIMRNPEGRLCYEIFWGRKEPCSPCEQLNVFETRRPQQGEYEFQSEIYEVHDSFLWDDDGSPLILRVAIDVTKRKLAEQALCESKAYLAAILESIPFEFWVIGPDGRYSMQNRICRERYGDSIGKSPQDICPNKEILSVWEANNRRAFAGEMVTGEVEFTFGNDQRYFYNIIAPIHDHERICGIVGTNVDITDRKILEAALKKINEELEMQVEERTRELKDKTRRLEEFNAALKVLLKQREDDRTELEESILLNVRSLVIPYLEKLKKTRLNSDQTTYLAILESHVREVTSPFIRKISEKYFGLTPVEIQAAGLIKEGKTTKEIAESLGISINTVSSHRFHIRKKLGLSNKKVNMRSYLKTMEK